jgi:DNA-binding transcriptional regulator YiaG
MSTEAISVSADKVREIRREAQMTQGQFAGAVGVGKVTVARWESGTRTCRD